MDDSGRIRKTYGIYWLERIHCLRAFQVPSVQKNDFSEFRGFRGYFVSVSSSVLLAAVEECLMMKGDGSFLLILCFGLS